MKNASYLQKFNVNIVGLLHFTWERILMTFLPLEMPSTPLTAAADSLLESLSEHPPDSLQSSVDPQCSLLTGCAKPVTCRKCLRLPRVGTKQQFQHCRESSPRVITTRHTVCVEQLMHSFIHQPIHDMFFRLTHTHLVSSVVADGLAGNPLQSMLIANDEYKSAISLQFWHMAQVRLETS